MPDAPSSKSANRASIAPGKFEEEVSEAAFLSEVQKEILLQLRLKNSASQKDGASQKTDMSQGSDPEKTDAD